MLFEKAENEKLVSEVNFKKNGTPRSFLGRIVFKKNGCARRAFAPFISAAEPGVFCSPSPTQGIEVLDGGGRLPLGPASLDDIVLRYGKKKLTEAVLDSAKLEDMVWSRLSGEGAIALSLSHDHYASVTGGVQLCLRREELKFRAIDIDYLHIHPFQPLPRLAHQTDDPDPLMSVTINGIRLGVSRMNNVIEAMRLLADRNREFHIFVHQLLGFNPEQVIELADAAKIKKIFYWMHDFFALCPNIEMTRNRKEFCGTPPKKSNACAVCTYGAERTDHHLRFEALFEKQKVHIVFPSKASMHYWNEKSEFKMDEFSVLPHIALASYQRTTAEPFKSSNLIRVGFLGALATHKGWPVFERLIDMARLQGAYNFIVLGATRPKNHYVNWLSVDVSGDGVSNMTKAVSDEQIDIVLHWPRGPETFSFTTFEAIEGGAAVVTNEISGNVAATVINLDAGVVLKDEQALVRFFLDGGARELALRYRVRRTEMAFKRKTSSLSAELISVGS